MSPKTHHTHVSYPLILPVFHFFFFNSRMLYLKLSNIFAFIVKIKNKIKTWLRMKLNMVIFLPQFLDTLKNKDSLSSIQL